MGVRGRASRQQREKARQEQEEGMEISNVSNLGEQEVLSRTGVVVEVMVGYLVIIAVITEGRGGRLPALVGRHICHCLLMYP